MFKINSRTNHQKNRIRLNEDMKTKLMQGNIVAFNLFSKKLKTMKLDLWLQERNQVIEYKI